MNFFRKKNLPDSQHDTTTPPAARSIYDHARAVKERFDEVTHPSELLTDEAWNGAARDLAASPLATDDLLTFALGENATIASLALAAAGARGDETAVATILEQLNNYSADWTKYFALATLDQLVPAPAALLGRVFVAMNDDWADRRYERFLVHFVRDFTRRRIRAGEPATFAGALDGVASSRITEVRALLRTLDADLVAPMRAEVKAHERQQVDVRFLSSIGTIHRSESVAPIAHDALENAATFIEQTLTAERRRSVLVVGEDGVGKTTIVREAAARLRARGWTVFEAGGPELLAGMSYIGEIEERMQKLLKQLAGRRVVWIIPRLHELVHAGSHRNNPNGVIEWILPEIDNGSLAVITEISPGAHQKLIQEKPRVRSAFVTARAEPLGDAATLELARRWSEVHAPSLSAEVLAEAWQLTTQYLGGRAAPGNLLGLLDSTRARLRAIVHDGDVAITLDDILVTLAQLTGLPNSVLDDREGLDLSQLRAHFASRVLGQPETIDVLVERVAMIKAGVTDPTRPFGVFLFAGPTGTGKTEVAKSLAEFLFGSAERMIRLDMSELKNTDSLARLTGESHGNVESLVDIIRKQPFSVVLLDELEKAHPHVWDLFLQVFDDGRLTDQRGVTADFRHAIIIMTSNIGAAIQTGGRPGFSDAAPAFHVSNVSKALEREFRKEFINRIDRVVVFRPLSRDTMRGILRKEITAAFKRRGLRNRNWAVEWEESAIEFLLNEGFTADLGARPLKRAVERHLLTPLAELIVTRRVPTGDQFLFIRAENDKLAIDFVDPDPASPAVEAAPAGDELALESLVLNATGSTPELERLRREYAALRAIVDSAEWSERKSIALSMTSLPEFWSSPDRFEILGEAEMRDRIESALSGARSLLGRLQHRAPSGLVRRVAQQLWLIGLAIDDLRHKRPSEVVIAIEARADTTSATMTNEWAQRVADMYRSWARTRGMRSEVVSESHDPYRLTMSVSGFAAHTILAREHGLHVLEVPTGHTTARINVRVRVAADVAALASTNGEHTSVRRYRDAPSPLVRDSVRNWRTGRVDLVLKGEFDLMR
ncbi:MAG TPA: AAA family ATPase [Thermoanaerobaculia bacterium]|nr:AAA family ATPase [Thermoanaerobaculia bacterium]